MLEQTNEIQYQLPIWKYNEISKLATKIFIAEGFFREDFDIVQMLESKNIMVIPYSKFSKENLNKMKNFKYSFWKDGLCLFQTSLDGKQSFKMIAYDDSKDDAQKFVILMHEFAHIILEHTQQSQNSEAEAIAFTSVMLMLKRISKKKRINNFIKFRFKGGVEEIKKYA